MVYDVRGQSRQLLNGAELGRLKNNGTIKEEEYAYLEGDVLMAENVKTQDRRVVGKANEILSEGGSKRVLKG
jgi:hypothetical protein